MRARNRRRSGLGAAAIVPLAAMAIGVVAGWLWHSRSEPVGRASAAPIEWNAIQAVPTRTPDAQDDAWERRGREAEAESADGPKFASVRTSFGFCFAGGGTNCVVDGDTFYLNGEKVRIAGIDAPETHPSRCDYEARLGNEATQMLHRLLNGGAVTMTGIDRDRDIYGRLLRNVAVDGEDVGESMIAAGVARPYAGGRRPWC